MRIKIAALALAVIAISAMAGASAFTTGNVERSASVDVVSDDAGLIALADGTSGDLVSQASNGQLTIDFNNGDARGVNPNAFYQLGSPDDPTNQSAFTISNLDGESHGMTVEYTGVASEATGGTENIQFQIYNSTGTEPVGTVSEESTSVTMTDVASGETLYVVMDIDTTGLTNSTSLSGTLNVSV